MSSSVIFIVYCIACKYPVIMRLITVWMVRNQILEVNLLECGIDHPPQSSAKIKEKVELYFYSLSVLSWQVRGWTLLDLLY
jgi:hypothetical protein